MYTHTHIYILYVCIDMYTHIICVYRYVYTHILFVWYQNMVTITL